MSQRPGTSIDGAVALVTGTSRGFGRSLVDELLERGAARVYATARSPQPATDPRVVPLALDVTDDASVRRAAEAAGDVSIVVNNAGIDLGAGVLDGSIGDLQAELDTNLFGVIRVSRAFAPALARHSPAALVNVLSVLSWLSFGDGYEVSKAAAWSATNALRLGLREQGITVTAVHVAFMDTDMTAGRDVPKSDPRQIARQTADAIEAGAFEVLADETTRAVKSQLSAEVSALYPALTAAPA